MSQQNLEIAKDSALGFYGKLPSMGDFVSRRLPKDFISFWDEWLQNSMATSRDALGEEWLQSYLTSPIWRFALSPGLAGKDAWLGIVMPSVDRVGRYFPLTIAYRVNIDIPLVQLFSDACHWFEELETVALAALDNDLTVEAFDQMVKNIEVYDTKGIHKQGVVPPQKQSEKAQAFYLEFENSDIRTEQLFPHLTALLVNAYLPRHSLWCSVGSEEIKPSFLMVNGMPPFMAYSGMISGQFQQATWELHQQKVSATPQVCSIDNVKKECLTPAAPKDKSEENNSISSTPEQRTVNNNWKSFSRTDTGMVRKYNEDAILDRPDLGLWVVADGMGGHMAGDVASKKIIHTLNKLEFSSSLDLTLPQVQAALQLVNNELKSMAAKLYEQQIIGSTVVTLIAGKTHFAYLWAGDSRLYRLRDNKLMQLTIDHCSEYEEITDILNLGSETGFKQNNVITRAVGADDNLELDCQVVEIQAGDVFLLSSDGLDKEVSFTEIEQILIENNYDESVEILVEQVLSRGARDNISVIVVEINEC